MRQGDGVRPIENLPPTRSVDNTLSGPKGRRNKTRCSVTDFASPQLPIDIAPCSHSLRACAESAGMVESLMEMIQGARHEMTITIRLSDEEHRHLVERAACNGRDLDDYIHLL